MVQFCIFLAPPRSGTQILGETVARVFDAIWLQEVFHENYVDPTIDVTRLCDLFKKGSFFNFRFNEYKVTPELSFPSAENQRKLFESYLNFLQRTLDSNRIILDVKYNSWHHLNDYWSFIFHEPGLVTILKALKIPIVQIIRRNLFLQYCSMQHAQATGIWYATDASMLKTNMINIDVIDCELFMSMIQKTSDLFLHWFGSQIICRVVYETMIRDGIISAEVVGQFVSIFGREPDGPAVSESIKITPPVREIIQNADDVIRYFSKTEYSHMIEQAFLM